jgi:hypothetical protein
MRLGRITTIAFIGMAALGMMLTGCGSGHEERLTKLQPMDIESSEPDTEGRQLDVPGIAALRFNPVRPRVGRGVSVVTTMLSDDPPVHLKHEWRLNGKSVEGRGESLNLSRSRAGDRLEVEVTPMLDGRAGQSTTHAVRVASLSPRIVGIRLDPPRGLTAGSSVTASPMLEDVDPRNVSLQYSWSVNDRKQFETDDTLSTKGLKAGDRITVQVVARAGVDVTEPFRSAELVLTNAPPTVTATPMRHGEDGIIRTRLTASDPDGNGPIRFELVKGPEGLELDALTGEISWDPSGADRGQHPVEVEVSDGQGAVTRSSFAFRIDGGSAPASPAAR